jgi:hypothetical protein
MRHGTKGAALAAKIDAASVVLPVDPAWDRNAASGVPNVGYRAPMTARDIERFAEAEYERMTARSWHNDVCGTCHEVLTNVGDCYTCEDDPVARARKLLADLGL